VLIALGRLGEAKECLLKAHAAGSLDETALVAALRGLVGAHVAKRQFAEALSTQELALALSSNDLDALNLGVLQLQAGEPELALATYRGLVAREDLDLASHARAWNYLGLALRGQGDLSAAEAAFRESLRILESGGDARENLAALLLAKGDEAGALREGKAVLAEAPSRARAAYLCMLAQHRWLARGGR
jgi:tetratricopeptide (TPR) repeat protein